MSLWEKIRGWMSGGTGGQGGEKKLYIVDAATLDSSNGRRIRMSPRAQIDMLKKLAGFANKESIQVYVVFEGSPLRQVPDKSNYRDVRVYFGGQEDDVADLIVSLQRDLMRRQDVIVITTDRQLDEQVRSNGGVTMRSTTFRRAMEAAGESMGGGGDPRRSNNNRRRRRGGRGRSRDDRRDDRPPRERPGGGGGGVRDMIDLLEDEPRDARATDAGPSDDMESDEPEANGNFDPVDEIEDDAGPNGNVDSGDEERESSVTE